MPSPRIVPTGVLGGRPGRDGRDGSNVLPTGEAIADSIENDETVKASLSASMGSQIATSGTPANEAVADQVAAQTPAVVAASESAGTIVNPSPVDLRALSAPSRRVKPVELLAGTRRNLWRYTEDLSNAAYSATATKTTDQVVVDGITLTRLTSSNFYHLLSSNINGLGLTPFVVGRRYLASYYVLSRAGVDRWFWMRTLNDGGSPGHGQHLVQPNVLTRVWGLFEANSTSQLAGFATPSAGYSSAPSTWQWFAQGNGGNADMYVGGFQIEDVGTTAKAGIAWIGDSTRQGSSGANDNQNAREVPGYVAALLNAYTFNRAVGGERLDQMDARWASDITPLAAVSKYVVIQGGINDIGQGRTLAAMQASTSSMATKAAADGLIAVFETITPFAAAADAPAKEAQRQSYNAWLKATFANVIDTASVVLDPFKPAELRRTTTNPATSWAGDRTHYTEKAKRAAAEYIAAWPGWDLPRPSAYQKVAATTWGGWETSTGTATRSAFDTASVTLPQLAERVKALLDDLAAAAQHGV